MSSLENDLNLQKFLLDARAECVRLEGTPPDDGFMYCNATADWFGCWNYTRAGTTMVKQCPDLPGFNINGMAYKNCTENGTWFFNTTTKKEYANYEECRMTKEKEKEIADNMAKEHLHIYISVVGFSLSIALLIISLFIFFKFRQLRCDRITLHKNLFISYLLTGITFILYNVLVILDGDVVHSHPVWCIVLHVIAQYCVVCNFAWMFCEGVYLHTIMVKVFSTGKWLIIFCTIVGWGCPVLLVSIYTGVRASSQEDNQSCWMHESTFQWIMFAPVVASILLNFIFLCNIVRLLITKLRQIPEAAQTRKAARATLILIPLLGIQYLLLPIRPEKGSKSEDAYVIALALLVSLQGAFVSIMFCFLNGEVITAIKRKWNLYAETTFSRDKRSRASSTIGTTTYTLVDHMSGVATSVT